MIVYFSHRARKNVSNYTAIIVFVRNTILWIYDLAEKKKPQAPSDHLNHQREFAKDSASPHLIGNKLFSVKLNSANLSIQIKR